MVFSDWGETFYYAFSSDLVNWTVPKELSLPQTFQKKGDGWHLWYATLIGSSSNFSGSEAKLYFAHIRPDDDWEKTERIFYQADVTFTANLENPSKTGNGGGCNAVNPGLLSAALFVIPFVRRKDR